ncbi:hypothetical protein HanRHA438_Chr03g0135891 [Helianthus annuus]|nr:hypothetical protein HanHA300_Chr03g0103301 [Helianthus annuus]KAJ0608985.1 hypothetical protein HanHA89_Chr03g0114971 [Helianthus annuus]KAJ0936871.1 hypothetical protein HanRHA438_Chr03g0135891 [Helianthus annuus]KAJ0944772.1 hypothetical protein HanPSC8_Chr03g0120531 [Helianthus annuus]
MAIPQLTALLMISTSVKIESDGLKEGSILLLTDYRVQTVGEIRFLVIRGVEVIVAEYDHMIGKPQLFNLKVACSTVYERFFLERKEHASES